MDSWAVLWCENAELGIFELVLQSVAVTTLIILK